MPTVTIPKATDPKAMPQPMIITFSMDEKRQAWSRFYVKYKKQHRQLTNAEAIHAAAFEYQCLIRQHGVDNVVASFM